MSTQKKSIDEIWRELNAPKPGRSGAMGTVLGGSTNMPGISTTTRTLPMTPPPTASGTMSVLTPMQLVVDEAAMMEVAGRRPTAAASSSFHYDPALAGVDPSAFQAFLSSIQRTINCLSDPDRNTRKQAITTLLGSLTPASVGAVDSPPPPDAAMLQALICGPLLHPVTAMLHDPGEAARLGAVEMLQRALGRVADLSASLPALMPEVVRRMGHLPVTEPAEEVRLQLAGLVSVIVQR